MTRPGLQRTRLIDDPHEDVVLVDLLRRASTVEPSDRTRELIWRRLNEEASARAGLAEPRRLIETDEVSAALLAREASFEPPYARQGRLYRQLAPPARPRRALAAGLALAATAAGVLLFLRPPTPPTTAGETIALTDGTSKRWAMSGVGDCVLSGEGARVVVASSDERGVRLHLDRGGLSIHAQKRPAEAPLIIEANGVEARVVGTILTVEAVSGGASVYVHEGLVEVRAPGREPVLVGAGQAWPNPLGKPPPWADDSMRTLAGVAVAARTLPPPEPLIPAAARTAPIDEPPARPEAALAMEPSRAEARRSAAPLRPEIKADLEATRKADPKQPVVASAAPVVAKTPVLAPAIAPPTTMGTTTTTVVVEMATQPPAAIPARSTAGRSLSGPQFDLEAERRAFDQKSPEELVHLLVQLQRRGPDARPALAGAYLAMVNADDATDAQRASAARNLFDVLDEQMGAVDMAIKVRRTLIPKLSGDDRSLALLSQLEDLVELHRSDEAIAAAEDCLQRCTPEHRVFAATLQPQLLLQEGRVEEAREATRLGGQDPTARSKTAFFFAQRAESLSSHGQTERARVAALLSLSLDPLGIQAPALRQKFK